MTFQLNRRTLRAILGVIWLLDGFFQLQPGMWTMDMISTIMQPASSGQPGPLNALLTWSTGVVSAHLIVMNAYVAVIQILIGVALIINRFPRLATVASVLHGLLVVWLVGEGLGLLLTGNALFLTGAPGAVVIYVVLGLAAWPKQRSEGASAPAGWLRYLLGPEQGTEEASLPPGWLRYALGAEWLLAAILQLQPAFLAPKGLSGAIASMEAGQPKAIVASLQWASSGVGGHGLAVTLALAALQLALAAGIIFARDLRPWLILGAVWALVAWWVGQGFGMLLTGMGTDPQVSPLILLLIATVWYQRQALGVASPAAPSTAPRRTPATG